jgi:hypothetical protein
VNKTEQNTPDAPAVGIPVDWRVKPLRCSRPSCDGEMAQGFAMQQTCGGIPDFPGREVVTMSPGGPGRLIGCWKCVACGWSVTAA